MLLVDAANVIGSRPDGWWKDRPGAARRLLDDIGAAVTSGRLTPPVVIVLEGQARRAAETAEASADDRTEAIQVVLAPGSGDDELVHLATAAATAGAAGAAGAAGGESITAVTADRALRRRLEAAGAQVVGPSWLLARIGA